MSTIKDIDDKLEQLRKEYREALWLDRQIIIRRAKALKIVRDHLLKSNGGV